MTKGLTHLSIGLLGAFAGCAIAAETATAGDYVVAQCHDANPAHQASTESADRGDYAMRDECTAAPDHALKVITNTGAPSGHLGYWYWQAPPGTTIVSVKVDAKLRRADGHKARVYVADDAGRQISLVASGTDGATSFTTEQWSAPAGSSGASRLYAALVCDNNGANCPVSSEAKTFVRNVEITLRDVSSPTVRISGDAVTAGWKRGQIRATSHPADLGGGVASQVVVVNGLAVAPTHNFPCIGAGTENVSFLVPCPTTNVPPEDLSFDTVSPPFRDGVNEMVVCVYDFARSGQPNYGCDSQAIPVDNGAPQIAFSNQQDPQDPEVISASAADATSGLAHDSAQIEYRPINTDGWKVLPTTLVDGEMLARVDSGAEPPGFYEFRASVADVAGNSGSTLLRADQEPMRLHFPLKERVDVDAFFAGGRVSQLVRYGRPTTVRGFLREPSGEGVADQRIVIRENFDDGSLVQRRTEHVRTDADGAFRSKIPAGPSRVVSIRYAGSNRYIGDRSPALDFNVRSRVALRASRRVKAGGSAFFRGAVGRYFARIPAGGKLVELQYKKKARTWNTADEAVGTSSRGRVAIRYRFRRFYTQPVTFVFRLKVTRESRWPYRVPASSRSVRVTVVPSGRHGV